MKYSRPFAFLCLLAFCACLPASAQMPTTFGSLSPQSEEVSAFMSEIWINKDGTIDVKEQIDYYFPDPRHGIYRDLPLRYWMDDGEEVVVPIDITSVSGAPYRIEDSRNFVRLRLGDPDLEVKGSQDYEISYKASGAIRYFDDHDELYWNVTGHEWDVPLRRVGATVYLPDTVDPEEITLKCYMGPPGSKSECLYRRSGNTASFAANAPLTVVVGWPKGHVAKLEPIPAGSWRNFASEYGHLAGLAMLLPLGMMIFMYRRWRDRGRDPKGRDTLVVQYDPPDKLTPGELGVLFDEHANVHDISATIVDLAVRGYLRIRDLKKGMLSSQDYEFILLKTRYAADPDLRPHEKAVLSNMFGGLESVTMKELNSKQKLRKAREAMFKDLYAQVVEAGYFPESPKKVRSRYLKFGLPMLIFGFMMMFVFWESVAAGENVAIFLGFVSLFLTGAIVSSFGSVMPRKTPEGVRAKEHAAGFKEYLKTAEKYRLQWQEKEHMFENFLPYAMVFGVVDKWSNALADTIKDEPDWYEGASTRSGVFNAVAFGKSMDSLSGSLNNAISPQKSSSGSGFSGGSSGGGFGGGGGGSW